ncbi:indole-3-glycerol phosphate synthase TrpC [Marinicrinis lubricantis]|uniref:Indole-3-glycerol phosphate synthase n=1 Tax=Marinicrinis lubricantis TaxID=2086470 RepID=A0ABW1IM65_9BACL
MYLDRIVAQKKKEVELLSQQTNVAELERQIADMPPALGFEKALSMGRKREMGLIAEVKKASPSKGLIRPDFHPVELARTYEQAGTDCISVLTDVPFFQGSNDYLREIRAAVDVPLLRKDFLIHPLQVYEARAIGADAVLLIAAILTPQELKELYGLSKDLGMDVLVEVHDQEELEHALYSDASLIGINNRNLKTFVTDLKKTGELISVIPSGKTIVSESGISSQEDVRTLQQMGAHALLIGEYFMRHADVGAAVLDLMGVSAIRESHSQ